MTIVPMLTLVFTRQGLPPEHVVHIAVATATATILFTSAHRRASISGIARSCGRWSPRWRRGSSSARLVGPQIVGVMSTAVLSTFFGVFVAAAATTILLDRKPKPTRELPGKGGMFAVGGGIGLVSSMVGAGGAFLSVPFMTACNISMRNCVATAAALGLPIAVAGTIGFVVAGLGQHGAAAVHDRVCLRAGAPRDRRRERDLRPDRRARRASLASEETQAGVRDPAVRARRIHAVEGLALRCAPSTRAARIAPAARSSEPCPSRCAADRRRNARAWAP